MKTNYYILGRNKEIVRIYQQEGVTQKEISAIFNLSRSVISKIICTAQYANKSDRNREIIGIYKNTDATQQQIADMFNLTQTAICAVLKGMKKRSNVESIGNLKRRKNDVKRYPCRVPVSTFKVCFSTRCYHAKAGNCKAFCNATEKHTELSRHISHNWR